jgi:hypothetical protein
MTNDITASLKKKLRDTLTRESKPVQCLSNNSIKADQQLSFHPENDLPVILI